MTVIRFPAHESPTVRQRVSENIRVLMARRGVKQPQIAEILGISQAAISRRMNGQTTWNVDDLEQIGAAFEVSVAELIGTPETDPRPSTPGSQNTRGKHVYDLFEAA